MLEMFDSLFEMPRNYMFGILLIIVILVIYMIYNKFKYKWETHITGFWEAPDSFLIESDLSSFTIFFAKPESNKSSGYVLMQRGDGELICNEAVDLEIRLDSEKNGKKYFSLEFSNCTELPFPKKMTLVYHPIVEKIVLFKNDIIHGVLYKNPEYTEMSITADPSSSIKPDPSGCESESDSDSDSDSDSEL